METINFLHLADEELVKGGRPEDLEYLVRIGGAFREMLALVDEVARLNDDVFTGRDEVFFFLGGTDIANDRLALSTKGALGGH